MSHPRSIPGISAIEVVDLCWRLSPEPTVEDQQADSEQAPDQRVEPKHPGCVGTGRPQGAGLNGAIGRVRDQGEQRAARGVVEQPGVPERDGDGGEGLDRAGPELGHHDQRDMPDGDPDGHQHGGGEWCPGGLQLGRAQPRKLASSGSWALRGLTMFMAIAIGIPDAELGDVGDGCAKRGVRAYCGERGGEGTGSASAYQIQLTRQRIGRDPMAFSPATPSVKDTTITCDQDAGGEEALPGKGGPTEGVGEQKELMTGCRRMTDMTA